ncbi:hypothetical protein SEA_WALTZ_56 [Arthrobacter phage Waltz]|nr:hypothetical protein SEA_WALTZ_56 [Arthrobacter phage Waltz]
MNKYEAALEPLAQEIRIALTALHNAEVTLNEAKARRRKCRRTVKQLEAALKLLREGGARLVEASPGEAGERRLDPARLVILDESLPEVPTSELSWQAQRAQQVANGNGKVVQLGTAAVQQIPGQQRSPGKLSALPEDKPPAKPTPRYFGRNERVRIWFPFTDYHGMLATVNERKDGPDYEVTLGNSNGATLVIHGGYLRKYPGAPRGEYKLSPGARVRFAGDTAQRGQWGRVTHAADSDGWLKVRPEQPPRDVVEVKANAVLPDLFRHNEIFAPGERVLIDCPGDSGHNKWAKVIQQYGSLVDVEREDTGGEGRYSNDNLLSEVMGEK